MRLFAGLGNPGPKYARNRHNVGFMAVERIAADHGFGPWRARFRGEVAEGRLGSHKVLLLKPLTFMNLSGESVREALGFYKLDSAALTVFHDELDLPPGRMKFKQGGGHAGHNGLRSIEAHVGREFARVRIGIGHPGAREKVTGWVLGDIPRAEEGLFDEVLHAISQGATALAAGDGARFGTILATRLSSPATDAATPARPAEAPPSDKPDPPLSPLQRLIERFR
ncbi:MAG: aminoacyl-tRNA hydrolase [Alphaproteobacteria bacterium HGW-Alphaproteobacteria-2]|nr:MAG: aminoacyl-tRNA hydrolase [Alphaproteobacteria bacterium HGW-Alphaproteobacteria-2]